MTVPMQVDIGRMKVLSAPHGEKLSQCYDAATEGVSVALHIGVVVGYHEFGYPVMGFIDLVADEAVPTGHAGAYRMFRGLVDNVRLEACLYVNPAEINQGTVRVLN